MICIALNKLMFALYTKNSTNTTLQVNGEHQLLPYMDSTNTTLQWQGEIEGERGPAVEAVK